MGKPLQMNDIIGKGGQGARCQQKSGELAHAGSAGKADEFASSVRGRSYSAPPIRFQIGNHHVHYTSPFVAISVPRVTSSSRIEPRWSRDPLCSGIVLMSSTSWGKYNVLVVIVCGPEVSDNFI